MRLNLLLLFFAWNFNKRLDPIFVDRFIYPPLSFTTSDL
jgi:hypothetical protein